MLRQISSISDEIPEARQHWKGRLAGLGHVRQRVEWRGRGFVPNSVI